MSAGITIVCAGCGARRDIQTITDPVTGETTAAVAYTGDSILYAASITPGWSVRGTRCYCPRCTTR